ncbi:hypothetical protein GCM10009860_17150 [Microbacterium mitrae]|uniref:Uncharacterized protein n=1 Tax=Microbacterium mitrae TaxID=664640 RepID=A0A5C8HNY1_9MICO|nr:hypothetical protein [Microbacterium mitrae]TXK04729.1 hypothetical protein FVP60_08680 [Microbacterium mitrae]
MDAMPSGARRYIKHVSTEEGVYGLILVSGLIAAAGIAHSSAGQILVIGTVTHVVFWLAHVYSGVVAGHGRRDRPDYRGRQARRHALASRSPLVDERNHHGGGRVNVRNKWDERPTSISLSARHDDDVEG